MPLKKPPGSLNMSRLPRSRHVLLLVETSEAYGRGIVQGIARYTEEHPQWSIAFEPRALADPLPHWIHQWRGDGIISRMPHKANMRKLLAMGLPVVELYADSELGVPRVRPDEDAVARVTLEHFLDRGLRQFAFFATDQANWIDQRWTHFASALAQQNFACHTFQFEPARPQAEATVRPIDDRNVLQWIRRLPKPCGVLCATDFHAMRLARACRTSGIVVPDEVAILGVDNDPVFCEICSPRLSSIDLNSTMVGYQAAALLDQMISGKATPEQGIVVQPQPIVVRESSDLLAIDDADMAQAARLIRKHAFGPLRVAQLAEELSLSRRILEQRFRRALHRTPKEEILRVRLERAKTLLATTNLSISQVAKRSGFSSLEYFSRVFRRRIGMAPRTFRKERQPSIAPGPRP